MAINEMCCDATCKRCAKLAAWLQWCLDHCDDSAEFNFGTIATVKMQSLLAGAEAPFPYD